MSLTERDRKILILLIPLLIVGGYWFLVLSPQREQAASLGDQVAQAEADRDAAAQQLAIAEAAKRNADSDYAAVVRLGKAIPPTVDTATLMVQLDAAADGTGIAFDRITTGARETAGTVAVVTESDDGPAAEAGGEPATTGAGQAVEAANEVAGGATGASATIASGGALDSVPLEFTFRGSFFELAELFHRLKRFVHVDGRRLALRGRLLTIDGFSLSGGEEFPTITAEVQATVYLSPRSGGAGSVPPAASATPTTPAAADPPANVSPPISTVSPR